MSPQSCNLEGQIDLLLGLESGQLLLKEVHQVNHKDIQRSHFSKDMQLCSSLLTDLLVCKGAIGGMRFGEGNSIYYSDQSPNAHLLQRVSTSGSHYKFFERATIEDLNLVPHGAEVTNYAPARIAQPLNCSAVAKELRRREDHDDEPQGSLLLELLSLTMY